MTSQQPWISPVAPEASSPAAVTSAGIVRLLVIDGDEVASARLTAELRPLRDVVSAVVNVNQALDWLGARSTDAIVLYAVTDDRVLEGTAALRERSDRPLIVVGRNSSETVRVAAFELGADDYVIAPLNAHELDQKARVLVRRDRYRRNGDQLLGPEGLVMHVRSHEADVGGSPLMLTPKEFAILQLLLERRGEVVAPDEISMGIWGYETFGSRNFVEAHISRLRGKLREAGTTDIVRTVRGVGYVVR